MKPISLATWTFGATAVEAALQSMEKGGSALDAVEAGCIAVEADPTVHSVGVGGLPDRTGQVSLDGSIMLSPSQCAGVANVRRHPHPVTIARHIMERTQHKLLAGEQADNFAEAMGVKAAPLLTRYARDKYNEWVERHPSASLDPTVDWQQTANAEESDRPAEDDGRNDAGHDTVGVLAIDSAGMLAGACSTSGLSFKVAGRVGDSPLIGQGLYVHPKYGAAVATGAGELAMGISATFLVVEAMRAGHSPVEAAKMALQRVIESYELRPSHQLGIIALRPDGKWSSASLRKGFSVAVGTVEGVSQQAPEAVLL